MIQRPKPSFHLSRRRAVDLDNPDLVDIDDPQPAVQFLCVAQPKHAGVDLPVWLRANRARIDELLCRHGAILFRGFGISSAERLNAAAVALSDDVLDYDYASTPRSRVEGKIYTSTDYSPGLTIPLHNEMSYASHWPLRLWLSCVKPAEQGGGSPLADCRAVYRRIPEPIRERFRERGVLYQRWYNTGLDLTWQKTFGTDDRATVERFCRAEGARFEWGEEDRLFVEQRRPGVAVHPRTGEWVWFNQANLFHISSLPADVQAIIGSEAVEAVPRNAFYGDGSEIPKADLDAVREALDEETRTLYLKTGDAILVDNVLVAHGRESFAGERRVLVAMSDKNEGPR